MSYQMDRLINVTTQTSDDGLGWQVVVKFPPHVRSRDKKKMLVWLKEYEKTIREKVPNMHVTVYNNDPRCVLVATSQSTDIQHSIVGRTKARMNHMFNILGRYGEGQARIAH